MLVLLQSLACGLQWPLPDVLQGRVAEMSPMPLGSTHATRVKVSQPWRGRGEQRERAQMFPFRLWVSCKMFGSWICKEEPDGVNRSCSLRVELGCL